MSSRAVDADDPDDGAPPRARILVLATIGLLLLAGVVGFEAWPLTAWRLFSLSRDAAQTRWVVEAVDGDGTARVVSLEELPLRYRQAEWPMAELPDSSDARREEVCQAIASAVADARPGTEQVRIVRDRQRLEETSQGWEVRHEPEVVHSCTPDAGPS